MDEIVTDARRHLPLAVSSVEEDSDGVLVAGKNWHLRINTDWELHGAGSVRIALTALQQEPTPVDLTAALVGREVVDFEITYHGPYGDVVLTFDDSSTLEVVSDLPYGEWIYSIWDADDPNRLPVFDLSGPCSQD